MPSEGAKGVKHDPELPWGSPEWGGCNLGFQHCFSHGPLWAMSFVPTEAANLNSSYSKTCFSLLFCGVAGCTWV